MYYIYDVLITYSFYIRNNLCNFVHENSKCSKLDSQRVNDIVIKKRKISLNIYNIIVLELHDRSTVVRLAPGNVARFKVIFTPIEVGKYCGKIRLHVVDNPYENMLINLEGECYIEMVILEGLQFEESKEKAATRNHKNRKVSSKQNSLVSGKKHISMAARKIPRVTISKKICVYALNCSCSIKIECI